MLPIPIAVTPGYVLGMAAYMVIVFGVCMLACLVPARRVLRVDPIAALRAD
jgi:ABC-type antimicrobial peptide transport system permease subunit